MQEKWCLSHIKWHSRTDLLLVIWLLVKFWCWILWIDWEKKIHFRDVQISFRCFIQPYLWCEADSPLVASSSSSCLHWVQMSQNLPEMLRWSHWFLYFLHPLFLIKNIENPLGFFSPVASCRPHCHHHWSGFFSVQIQNLMSVAVSDLAKLSLSKTQKWLLSGVLQFLTENEHETTTVENRGR